MTTKLNQTEIENYSKEYAKILCDEFFSRKEKISGKQILNLSNISQINLFSIRSIASKWMEEMQQFSSPFFDYTVEEVKNSQTAFMNAVSKNISVDRRHFEPILTSATAQTLSLATEPRDFLKDFIEQQGENFNENKLDDLLKYVQINKATVLSLKEAEATNYSSAMQHLESGADAPKEDNERVFSLFEAKLPFPEAEKPAEAPEVTETSFFEEVAALPVVPSAANLIAEPEEKTSPIETPKLTIEKPKDIVFRALPVEDKKLNENFVAEKSLNDTATSENSLHDSHAKAKIEGIQQSISLNQKFIFINNLFGGNRENYDHAIEEIESCKDYFEAKELLLKKYVVKYNWNVVSHEAEEFFEIIKRRFN